MLVTKADRKEFIRVLQREFPDEDVVVLCRLLMRNATTYGYFQETRGMRELTPHEWRKETRTRRRIIELCGQFPGNVVPLFEDIGDGAVRLRFPSGRRNESNRQGWLIPTN